MHAAPTNRSGRPWHAVTWLAWAMAGSAALQLAPNPLYVAVVIAIAGFVVATYALDGPYARAFPFLVGLSVVFALLRVVLTALTTHSGIDTIVTTPSFTMPEVLGGFMVGGSIDAPIVAQALAEGLVIVGIVSVFAAFNAVISHHELLQSLPRAFYEVGLIVAVGVAFVPSTIAAVHDVREADRARTGGRVVRRGRIVRQLVPVLETGLERAITLSESMDSRGFAHGGAAPREHVAGWCGAGALLALAGAFVALVARESGVALGLGLLGTSALIVAVSLASRGTRRVRYRPRPLTRGDWTVMATAWLAPAALAAVSIAGDATLQWSTSPLQWPGLHAVPLLALAALVSPLLISSDAGAVRARRARAVPVTVQS